jgi:outer membrane protein TolC
MFSISSRRLASATLAAALWVMATPAAADEALSLAEALRLAQQRSRALPAQDAAASAAREMSVAAGQLPDPALKAGINNLPVNKADRFSLTRDFMTMRSIGLMQEFTRAGKRQARAARLEREADAAQAARAVALADLRRETAMAWLERHYLERTQELLRLQRDEAALQVEAAEAGYRGGRGAQADVFAARSAVAQIDDRVRQTELQAISARTRLTRWLGGDAERPLAAPPDLARVPMDAERLDAQLEHHPQLALLARQEAMALAEVDAAQSNKRADWSVELMFSQRGSAYSNMVSLNVSVPLQWDQKNRQDREVAARLAMVEQVRAQRDETLREHAAQTRTWLQQWRINRTRLGQYDDTLIPLARERTQAALAAYRGAAGSLAAVLEARRAEIDTRMERLRLEMENAALWAQLEYLIPPVPTPDGTRHAGTQEPQR